MPSMARAASLANSGRPSAPNSSTPSRMPISPKQVTSSRLRCAAIAACSRFRLMVRTSCVGSFGAGVFRRAANVFSSARSCADRGRSTSSATAAPAAPADGGKTARAPCSDQPAPSICVDPGSGSCVAATDGARRTGRMASRKRTSASGFGSSPRSGVRSTSRRRRPISLRNVRSVCSRRRHVHRG